MSIQVSIKAPGLNLTAMVKDAALVALMGLVQEHRDDVAEPVVQPTAVTSIAAAPQTVMSGTAPDDDAVRHLLAGLGSGELLNLLQWESFPEKILLLGAWHEAKGGQTPWRSSDVTEVFMQAREKPPANFPRDIKQCIRSGWIHTVSSRTYSVTRTGWNKVGQALSQVQQST